MSLTVKVADVCTNDDASTDDEEVNAPGDDAFTNYDASTDVAVDDDAVIALADGDV